jgi:RNA polymerase sigma-70 factor (ECF subfamily)
MGEAQPVAELVARARRGERKAFDELARRHLRACYAVALAVLGCPEDAEDVAQEALIATLQKIDDVRDPARYSGWVVQAARNRALNAMSSRKLREAPPPQDDRHVAPVESGMRGALLAALAKLHATQREVVLLHDLEGWTHAEIAQALDISEVASRQHLFVARRAMRERLREGEAHGP